MLWRYGAGGVLSSAPAIGTDGVIYFASYDRQLYALNPDGSEKWRRPLSWVGASSPVIGPNASIYVGSGRVLHAFRPDGSTEWDYTSDDSVAGVPSIAADGTIFFSTVAKSAYALHPNGTLNWRTPNVGVTVKSSLLTPDGRLIFGITDGPLVVVRTEKLPADLGWPTHLGNAQRNGRGRKWVHPAAPPQVLYAGEPLETIPQLTTPNRTIVRAELFAGTNRVAWSTNAPFDLRFSNLALGTNEIFVQVIDDQGTMHRSDSTMVHSRPLVLRSEAISPAAWLLTAGPLLPGRQFVLQVTSNLLNWETVELQPSTREDEIEWTLNWADRPDLRAFRVEVTR
jgi:hypothetical protein